MSAILDRGLTEQQMREKLAREDRQGWYQSRDLVKLIYDRNDEIVCRCSTQAHADTILRMAHSFGGLVEALERIACYDDERAESRLRITGSYGSFDEPGSVEIAREALRAANLEKVK